MKKQIYSIITGALLVSSTAFGQMKVVSNGNVGVKNSNPIKELDVKGNIGASGAISAGWRSGSADAAVEVGPGRTASGNGYLDITGDIEYLDYGLRLIRYADGTSVFDHRGLKPFYLRTVEAAPILFSTSLVERMRIGETGLVGIGRVATSHSLEVNGNAAKTTGGGSWVVLSDKKVKKDIKPFKDGLDKILKLNPVWYKYNGKGGSFLDNKVQSGFIAQEVQEVAPYMVTSFKNNNDDENEKLLAVDASAVQLMLINAIKEQQHEIQELKNELAKIKDNIIGNIEKINKNGALLINEKNIDVYPNPVGHELKVVVAQNGNIDNKTEEIKLEIYDLNGRIVKEAIIANGVNIVNTSTLLNGEYFYNIFSADKRFKSNKIIVQNK